jgi:hypothetical protein
MRHDEDGGDLSRPGSGKVQHVLGAGQVSGRNSRAELIAGGLGLRPVGT